VYSPVRTPRVAVLAAVLTCSLIIMAGCSKQEAPPPPPLQVKVFEAVKKDLPVYREWVGQAYGIVDIELRARVAGWLQGIHFREGMAVKEGDLLYTIDQSELQQAVAQGKARVAEVRTMLVRAKSDVDRYRPLAEAGAVSQRDLESAEAEYGARLSELDAAQAELNVAQINLGYATIRAPISGLIGISAARVGDFVGRAPNVIILNTISRIDTIRVKFSVSEQEYLDIVRRFQQLRTAEKKGPPLELEMVLADGSVFPNKGRALNIERNVDAATGTLRIEAAFKNTGNLIRPGQFARIRGKFDELKDVTVVPARAILEIQGQPTLYVIGSDNKAQFRRLKAGPVIGGDRVVYEGVAVGEKVVVDGIQRVRPDMVVDPVTMSADSLSPAPAPVGGR
jgi:membrane fusion protein, multidrug efflux system